MYSKAPFVSIIIVNRNGVGFVENCVRTILNTDYPTFEVILIDNASSDGSSKVVKKLFDSNPRLSIISLKRHLGLAEGRNYGARLAKGEYVAFIDHDIVVNPQWLTSLIDVLQSDRKIAVAHALRIDPQGEQIMGYTINSLALSHVLIYGYKSLDEIKVFSTNPAMVFRRKLFFKIGMFDRYFFLGGEDIDLCWRVWLSGHAVVCVPASIVYHTKEERYKPFEERVFYSIRNRMVTLIKNYELHNVLKYLSIFMITVILGLIYFTIKRKINIVRNIGKALKSLIINFGYVWKQRLKVQSIRRVSDKQIQSLFIKGRWRLPLLDKKN